VQSAVDTHIEAAEGHEKSRRWDLAENEYRLAVAAAKTRAEGTRARGTLASALLFWGKTADARTVLEELLALDPKAVGSWHDLGVVRQSLGDAQGAKRALKHSIKLAPNDPRSRIALAAVHVNLREFHAAQEQYRALQKMEIPETLRHAIDKALRIIDREIEASPATGLQP